MTTAGAIFPRFRRNHRASDGTDPGRGMSLFDAIVLLETATADPVWLSLSTISPKRARIWPKKLEPDAFQ